MRDPLSPRTSHQEKEQLFQSPKWEGRNGGPEVMLSWRMRFPRIGPISDILGVDNKGNLGSSVLSVIEEEPQKDLKKHP